MNENEYESKEVAITTLDNPFSPFDDFYNWYRFDVDHDYNTCSKLARLTKINDLMTFGEINNVTEESIDRLIEIDPLKIYKKIYKE